MGEKKDFGYLIRITHKKSDRAPDMEGQLAIPGQRFDLVGWVKLSKKGNKYLSILATPQSANSGRMSESKVAASIREELTNPAPEGGRHAQMSPRYSAA